MRLRLVSARVMTLLILLRTSAELGYRRHVGITEFNRRLLSLLGNYAGLTSAELVALTGQEKAQISRAVGALVADGLIERPSLRAPIVLSPAGRGLYDLIMRVAATRNEFVVGSIAPADRARFTATTRGLIERAALLLRREREDLPDDPPDPLEPPSLLERVGRIDAGGPLSGMIAPPLMTLSVYLNRSATIACRRAAGLSLFGWQILSQVGEHQPLTLARLVTTVARDKSQVGRTVKGLETEGLVVARRAGHGRREVMLGCTPAGDDVYAGMCATAIERDDFLFAECPAAERDAYVATLDRLTANAAALLAHERAMAST
ncbi:MAG: MarR family winged helix-turn-helix transcriptional regulator [Janthinobacterium lividum]